MYKFRSFQKDDVSEISRLAKKAWEFTYKDIFSKEKIEDFVNRAYNSKQLIVMYKFLKLGYTDFQIALENDKIIGFSQIGFLNYWVKGFQKNKEIKLVRLYLDPDYIGKGIASKLLSLAEKWAIQQGFSYYGLEVHKDNTLGIKFYQRKGFTQNSNKDNPEEGHLFMEKTIMDANY